MVAFQSSVPTLTTFAVVVSPDLAKLAAVPPSFLFLLVNITQDTLCDIVHPEKTWRSSLQLPHCPGDFVKMIVGRVVPWYLQIRLGPATTSR